MERLVNARVVEQKLAKLEEANEYWHNKTIELIEENRKLKEINSKLVKINSELSELIDISTSLAKLIVK